MGEWREQRSFSFFSFLPLSMRRNTNMEEPKSKAKRGAKTAAAAQEDKITLLPLSELHDFPNHPFKVRDDEAMQETAEFICKPHRTSQIILKIKVLPSFFFHSRDITIPKVGLLDIIFCFL